MKYSVEVDFVNGLSDITIKVGDKQYSSGVFLTDETPVVTCEVIEAVNSIVLKTLKENHFDGEEGANIED